MVHYRIEPGSSIISTAEGICILNIHYGTGNTYPNNLALYLVKGQYASPYLISKGPNFEDVDVTSVSGGCRITNNTRFDLSIKFINA